MGKILGFTLKFLLMFWISVMIIMFAEGRSRGFKDLLVDSAKYSFAVWVKFFDRIFDRKSADSKSARRTRKRYVSFVKIKKLLEKYDEGFIPLGCPTKLECKAFRTRDGTKIVSISSQVVAPANGFVEEIFRDELGYTLKIKHTDEIQTVFLRLAEVYVKEGEFVSKGQLIGRGKKRKGRFEFLYFIYINGKRTNTLPFILWKKTGTKGKTSLLDVIFPSAWADEEKVFVLEVTGYFRGNEYIPPSEGWFRALEMARREALFRAGVKIRNRTIIVTFADMRSAREYFTDVLEAYSNAIVEDEKILERKLFENWIYFVRLRVRLRLVEREEKIGLEAWIEKKGEGRVSAYVFRAGEHIIIRARTLVPCYFWIFWVDDKGNAHVVFPTPELPQNSPTTDLTVPPEGKGVLYVDTKATKSVEKLVVVATPKKINLVELVMREAEKDFRSNRFAFTHIARALSKLDEWDWNIITYEIYRSALPHE